MVTETDENSGVQQEHREHGGDTEHTEVFLRVLCAVSVLWFDGCTAPNSVLSVLRCFALFSQQLRIEGLNHRNRA